MVLARMWRTPRSSSSSAIRSAATPPPSMWRVIRSKCWMNSASSERRASATGEGVVAVIAMLCVAGIANRWIKLSLHMASLAFSGMALLALWPPAGFIALVLLPLLAWSRLRMARHTVPEVIGGSLLGLLAGIALRLIG